MSRPVEIETLGIGELVYQFWCEDPNHTRVAQRVTQAGYPISPHQVKVFIRKIGTPRPEVVLDDNQEHIYDPDDPDFNTSTTLAEHAPAPPPVLYEKPRSIFDAESVLEANLDYLVKLINSGRYVDSLKVIAEIRMQTRLGLEVRKQQLQYGTTENFIRTVLETIGEASPALQKRILEKLQHQQALKNSLTIPQLGNPQE